MIKTITSEQKDNQHQLHFTFKLFGSEELISDNRIFESEKQAMDYLAECKRQVFLFNFDRFANNCYALAETEKQLTSSGRLYDANTYFNFTEGLTLQKICSMVIGVQNHMMAVLPAGKNKDYDMYFSQLNEIIKFSKSEIK